MNDVFILLVTIVTAILLTVFNLTTVAIALLDRKLRCRISNYPVISFLIASTFQGLFAAPITIYKQMEHEEHVTGWVCDLSRVSYYLCHHLIKVSLVIVSFDRFISIKYPFKYEKVGKKKNMIVTIAIIWLVTITIDMLPFIHEDDDDVCHYVTNKHWTFFIIIVYDIIPFLLIAINYILIWTIAAKVALLDRSRSASLRREADNPHDYRKNKQTKIKTNSQNEFKNKGKKLKFMLELKATKTSLALMSVYVVCWGPYGLYFIVRNFCPDCLLSGQKTVQDGLMYLCFSSNVLAPLSYCWLSNEYRKAGKRILRRLRIGRIPSYSHQTFSVYHQDIEMVNANKKKENNNEVFL